MRRDAPCSFVGLNSNFSELSLPKPGCNMQHDGWVRTTRILENNLSSDGSLSHAMAEKTKSFFFQYPEYISIFL